MTHFKKTFKQNLEPKVFDEARLYNYCIFLLSKSNYSSFELISKMKKYQPDLNIINSVISKISQYGYINDKERFLSIYNAYIKKEGEPKIIQRLYQKKFPKEFIKNMLLELKDKNSDIEDSLAEDQKILCMNLLIKKYKIYQPEQYQKYMSFLASKGFSFDTIKDSIQLFKNN